MRIQSIAPSDRKNNLNFKNIKIMRSEIFPEKLLTTVKEHEGLKILSENISEKFPDRNLKCMLALNAYNSETNSVVKELVLFTSTTGNVLKPKINIIKRYCAETIDQLVNLVKKDNIDSKQVLDSIV